MTTWAPSLSSTSPQPPLVPSLQCEAPTLPCLPPLAYAPMQPGPAAVHLSLYCNHLITSLPSPTFHLNECLCHNFLIINIFLGTKFRYPMLCILPLSQNPTIKKYAIFGVPYQLWTSMCRVVSSEQRKCTPMCV